MTKDSRTTEALLARRALAETATPGPWEKGIALRRGYGVTAILDRNGALIADTEFSASQYEESDAAHIAANSPDVVMADIEEILRLRAEVERLEKEADWLAENLSWYCVGTGHHNCIIPGHCPCVRGVACLDVEGADWREAARKAVEKTK